MLFTNLCERFIRSGYGNLGYSCFWAFWFLLCALCMLEVLGLVFLPPSVYKAWVLLVCLFFGSRPLGVDLLGYYLLDHWEESLAVHNTAKNFGDGLYFCWGHFLGWKPYMLALVGQPSLHGYYACMVFWDKGALWRNCRQKNVRPLFLLFLFFCVVGTL